MSDSIPPPSEKTVAVNNQPLSRLWTWAFISLGLNGLILAALLIGFLCHHFHGPPRFADHGDRGGFYMMNDRGFGHHFRNFGGSQSGMGMGPGWEQQRGFRGGGFQGMGPMGMMRGGNGPGMGMDMMKKGPPNAADTTNKILNRLTRKLALTDDQQAKLRPIIDQQVAQIQKDMEAQRQAMQKLMDDTKAKVKPILNADQQQQLDQIKLPGQQNPPDQPVANEPHP